MTNSKYRTPLMNYHSNCCWWHGVGIENMLLESAYQTDTDKNHGWEAVWMNR